MIGVGVVPRQELPDRVAEVPNGTPERARAEFYGNLYLGLYADAQGDREKAHEYVALSVRDVPHHYTGDVARVYAEYLAAPSESEQ